MMVELSIQDLELLEGALNNEAASEEASAVEVRKMGTQNSRHESLRAARYAVACRALETRITAALQTAKTEVRHG